MNVPNNHTHPLQEALIEHNRPVKVLYISSYIPRKCGIATFTRDLTRGVNLLNPLYKASIAVLDSNLSLNLKYPPETKYRIFENSWADYQRVVRYINYSGAVDLVSLQHEFGIFGQNQGQIVTRLVEKIQKPIITTLHTVLADPTPEQKAIIKKLSGNSAFLVVMLDKSAQILQDVYAIPKKKIVVVAHGVPDFARADTQKSKIKLKLPNKVVMSSSNLISPSKGLEYAIAAIPEIIKTIPNFLYLVIGQTHPVILDHNSGKDLYRRKLMKMVKELGIGRYVRFVNEYLPLDKLMQYISASDFYITPYLDPQHAASGALSYAIGAGKVCLSTPYLYAKEMLSGKRGLLVAFKNSKAIAKAVIKVFTHPKLKEEIENNAYEMGRMMTWANIGHQYFHLFHQATSLRGTQ